ncbi:MAG: DNA primase catalytic subunit PriS [Candidatus Methanomethylophilaceae archaeon]|nr:DNA primase catalytic subunit PriS [Candidatus Methanomethylophilaceae archaeon]MDD3378753.1 DNA primase catalytic subunit PriS [Candidatus Methanomethylophilaceae archaeon]MDY0223778.1 DNA primase catalytic subunit PriS [Candidatus Methanomethylophilaceae archaeon]
MDHNSRFLLKSFRKYYKEYDPVPYMPERYTKREFGFMFFDKEMMQRHLGFTTPDDLKKFMIAQVPKHSYYSTAYYRRPAAPTMDEKEWLGAELIFDLDADHLAGADQMTYDEMMIQIRSEMINLVDSFLYSDLGFDENQVHLMFSGGRGYHAHVLMPDIATLGTHERRELVDYITCSGLDIDWIFPFHTVALGQYKTNSGASRTNITEDRTIPPTDSGGWKLKMRNGLKEVVNDFCNLDVKELKKTYPSIHGTSNQSIVKVQENIKKSGSTMFEKNTMASLTKPSQRLLIKIMQEDKARMISGEVDKPVTPDIKRLIRLPGSVHGKTGLKVTPITRDELTDYNPLLYAVPETYSNEPTKITLRRDYRLNMKDVRLSLKKGETEVPEFAAVFLVGRKEANYGYDSEQKDSFF